jgi:SAM-dependent methyltransferase
MRSLNKVCDGADWFDPELRAVIDGDLQELARFHRKQWEFAMILLALRRAGALRPDAVGLSMGAGKERLLYAVARSVRRVVATDLYDAQTEWEKARTDDPDRYIKEDKPFPVDDAKLQGLRMDMRSLDFEDEAFDFCYSSCAIEHIGGREDFLKHLSEAHRVLKPGGVYALTTELHYGSETIEHAHNYYFSPGYLRDLIGECDFAADPEIDTRIAHHRINYPLPPNLDRLCFDGPDRLAHRVLGEAAHVQLLLGRHPFTSLSVVLKKDGGAPRRKAPICFAGLEESREFLGHGVAAYRDWIEQSRVGLDPFSFGGKADLPAAREGETVFHTDYGWFGSAPRTFRVTVGVAEAQGEGATLELLVHRASTLQPDDVACVQTRTVALAGPGSKVEDLTVDTDDEHRYAVLGRLTRGSGRFDRVAVEARPAR